MPGQRSAHGRARGSWALRFAGIAVVVLLAGAAAGYLAVGHHHHKAAPAPLPTTVASEQAVGLLTRGAPGKGSAASQRLLLLSGTGLAFAPVKTADPPAGYPEWTADQMTGGSYVFIYISSGECLTSARGTAPALQRCNLSRQQRWTRAASPSGQAFGQLRNAADGRCLTAARPAPGAATAAAAELASCARSPAWTQLIAFSSGY